MENRWKTEIASFSIQQTLLLTLCLQGTDKRPQLLSLSFTLRQNGPHRGFRCKADLNGEQQVRLQLLQRALGDAQKLDVFSPVLAAVAFCNVGWDGAGRAANLRSKPV